MNGARRLKKYAGSVAMVTATSFMTAVFVLWVSSFFSPDNEAHRAECEVTTVSATEDGVGSILHLRVMVPGDGEGP